MGTRIALELIDELRKSVLRKSMSDARLGSVILAAADETDVILGDVLRWVLKDAPSLGRIRTLYAAERDVPLLLSKFMHGVDRAGLGGKTIAVINGIESIDATEAEAAHFPFFGLSHAHVFDVPKVAQDLKHLLMEDKPAAQRTLAPGKREDGLAYWRIPR
jgi:esterase/lipase superfamily enzyme